METITTNSTHTLVPGWTSDPIPNFSLSASGLIVLADLSTIAQRTALRGGSSWFDSLLLAPGLHYQQAADDLARGEAPVLTAVEVGPDGKPATHRIVNQAVVNYVLRTAEEGRTVVLDVGELPVRSRTWRNRMKARKGGQRASLYGMGGGDDLPDLGWLSNLLYLTSPLLTCAAAVFIVLLEDWWALAFLLALMLSRVVNILVIKLRSRPKPAALPAPFFNSAAQRRLVQITQYTISINPTTAVVLRGLPADLQALTTTVWLRPKTGFQGYLEAMAKMLVYLVAACSGNATQAGNLVLLVLLLVSGGLLALSNSNVKGLTNGGRLVAPSPEEKYGLGRGSGGRARRCSSGLGGGPGGGNGDARRGRYGPARRETTDTWPETSDVSSMADSLKGGRPGNVVVDRGAMYPSDDAVEYHVQLESRIGTVEVTALR